MNVARWEKISLHWHMDDLDHLCLDRRVLNAVLNEMVALGAFPKSIDYFGFNHNISQGQVPIVRSMQAAGFVEHRNNGRWCFTSTGLGKLTIAIMRQAPKPVFA